MSIKHSFIDFIYRNQRVISKLYFTLFFLRHKTKKNKIVFLNFSGCGYGCNPKYIAEEILRQKLPIDIVWLVKDEFNDKKNFPANIRLVNIDSSQCLYELATAKVWINNSHTINLIKKGLLKKKNQIYINTWHGSLGIKRIDGDVERFLQDRIWKDIIEHDSKMTDIMISNSSFETEVYRSSMWFKNKIVELGHARNDIFFKDNCELKKEIKRKLGVNENENIIVYMPSFRDDYRIDCFNIDYKNLKDCLDKTTGKSWKVLTKFHPRNILKLKYLTDNQSQQDISFYPDLQEIMIAADAIISDYSSCMFDFMLTRKPCFIYATDIERYNTERGFYYPLESTPFPIAANNEELISNIANFDNEEYIKKVNEFLAAKKCVDDGNASERIVLMIKDLIKHQK